MMDEHTMRRRLFFGEEPKVPLKSVTFRPDELYLDTSKSWVGMQAQSLNEMIVRQYHRCDNVADFLSSMQFCLDVTYRPVMDEKSYEKLISLIEDISRIMYKVIDHDRTAEAINAALHGPLPNTVEVEPDYDTPAFLRHPGRVIPNEYPPKRGIFTRFRDAINL